jgi:hypothetical protein
VSIRYWILNENNEPITVDLMTWAKWLEHFDNRIVAFTQITSHVQVSTVFLSLDHNFFGEGPPLLFETMIFGGERSEYQCRWSTWDEAKRGHDGIVAELRAAHMRRQGSRSKT